MKKLVVLFFLLVIGMVGKTQDKSKFNPELIACVFGEMSTDKNIYGHNYGADLRLMLGSNKLRIGPYGHYLTDYTVNGSKVGTRYYYEDYNKTFGISLDSWKEGRYWWLNLAYRWSNDHGGDGLYEEWQKDQFFYFFGGLRLVSPYDGWCGDWLIMVEYQVPFVNHSTISAFYKGDTLKTRKSSIRNGCASTWNSV